MKYFLRFAMLFAAFYAIESTAQQNKKIELTLVTISIMNEAGEQLPFPNFQIEQRELAMGDAKGRITFLHDFKFSDPVSVEVSYAGKETATILITALDAEKTVIVVLKTRDLMLETVEVNAVRKKALSNSSLLIGRQAIESVQSYSMADIMQLMPGKAILNPDLQNAQFLNLRTAVTGAITNPLDAYSNGKINDYMRNNAFGIGIFVDETPVSNNANMQLDSYGKWGTIKVFDRHVNADNSNFNSSGVDLRQMPTSAIESVEVIAGVAPVKYGDISDGAVLINRRAGVSPYIASIKFQAGVTNLNVGKGLQLGKRFGTFSYHLDYLTSSSSANTIGLISADKRNKLKSYNRINTDFIWTKSMSKIADWTNSLSVNFYTDLDGRKSDPDAYLKITQTKNSAIRISNRGNINFTAKWLDHFNYNFSASLMRQFNFHEEYITNADQTFIADGMTSGIYETDVTPPYYISKMKIEGMPFNVFGRVEWGKFFGIKNTGHHLTLGINTNYDNNFGKGKIFDADAPYFQSNIGGRGERSYNFRHKVYLIQLGVYLQDAFDIPIGKKTLHTVAGIRLNKQAGRYNLNPRINSAINLSSCWQINAAYGISSKAPSTAYLYPENVYFDNLLIGQYDPDYRKRLYLIQTVVKSPQNPNLKSSTGTTLEAGLQFKNEFFQASLTAYQKTNRNGIAAQNILDYIQIPEYKILITNPDSKPSYYPTGNSRPFPIVYYQPQNKLYSRNRGVELILSTKKISSLQTAFNLSASYIKSFYHHEGKYPGGEINLEREAIVGIYQPTKQLSEDLVSMLSVTHHISHLGLIINWRLQNFWLKKTIGFGSDGYPVAYINQRFEEIPLTSPDFDNGRFRYLISNASERFGVRQPNIITNYHIRISKQILTRYMISFYANNLFNYRPYVEIEGARTYFNQPPTFGVDITLKL